MKTSVSNVNPALRAQRESFSSERGMLMAEFSAAIAIFALVVFTSAAPAAMEQALVRRETSRAVAMEIVDGEMEILAAGAWRKYGVGTHEYAVPHASTKALPPGRFVLAVTDSKVSLEWHELKANGREIMRVSREFKH